jgi:integrase
LIEHIQTGEKRREIADAHLPGLYLVVQPSPSGAKSWAVRYRHGGRTRKYTLGAYPAIDLKIARELGAKALRAAAENRDPAQEAKAAQKDSIEAIVDEFLAHSRRTNRPRTTREYERLLRVNVLPRWRGRLVYSITRRDVRDLLEHLIEQRTGNVANRTLAPLHIMMNWAVEHDIIAASPCQGIKKPAVEIPRDRVLTGAELRDVWIAADAVNHRFGSVVKLLILTAQRLGEVMRMEWDELDLNTGIWTLPAIRAKNNKQHFIPLPGPALDILRSVPRIDGCPYVFSAKGTLPLNNPSNLKPIIDARLPKNMPHWTLHDLRRTGASGMAKIGISIPVIEKVLNHTSGTFRGIVGVYQRHDFADEKRAALDAWARFVIGLVEGHGPSNVTVLRSATGAA